MKLTNEQLDIINSESKRILINAKAGTGKTTTLIEFTKKRPFNTFLYLAYNKEIKNSSKRKFFGNTDVFTIHGLAYKELGYLYEKKLTDNLKIYDIIKYLKLENNDDNLIKANSILNYLMFYFTSKSDVMFDFDYKEEAIQIWNMMQDVNNKEVKMIHEGYLKLFQSYLPELNYDYILVDEAQDSNEVMLDIILNQKANLIFVGDKDQEIYGFRNVKNIFHQNLEFDNFYLTKSFRFGVHIADIANKFLDSYKEQNIHLEGLGKDEIVFELDEPCTYITRTNAYLFDKAIEYIRKDKKVHILGGENFVFEELNDAYHLYKGNLYKIKNPYIKSFKNFLSMKKYSEKTKDIEIFFLCKIIEKYKDTYEEEVLNLKSKLTGKKSADVILTTIHKSKGLEFFNVILGEDFYPLSRNDRLKRPDEIPYEEINLYYVALTRAVEKIKLNSNIWFFLRSIK